jgi:hypothetical protein
MSQRRKTLPRLTVRQILRWADAHFARTGRWPVIASGRVLGAPGETWARINGALRHGFRGLDGGSSLGKLLVERRAVRRNHHVPKLSIPMILGWTRLHYQRTGRFPTLKSGPLIDAPGESWWIIDLALRQGQRGLNGGSSLAKLLAEFLGASNRANRPQLSVKKVLTWADAYFARHKRWPTRNSGPIDGVPGETWRQIERALSRGSRRLPREGSLAKFLAKHRGFRNKMSLPRLSTKQILSWATAHYRRTASWPNSKSGPIVEAPSETWDGVNWSLTKGRRGLTGRSSLHRLVCKHRGILPRDPKPLTERQIVHWAKAYYQRTGKWPSTSSGPIAEAPSRTWSAINQALRNGYSGLTGGSSLSKLLAHRRPPIRR